MRYLLIALFCLSFSQEAFAQKHQGAQKHSCKVCKKKHVCTERKPCIKCKELCERIQPKEKECEPENWWAKGWSTTLFGGPLTSQTTSKIISSGDFGDSGIIAIAGAKELTSFFCNRLGLELEGQAVQHFGDQDHFELNPAVLILRWKDFPWNKHVPTTFAIGDGISIAMEKPKLEVDRRGKDDTSRVLNYVMAEATFSHPCYRNWAFVLRYHHRSGLFGAFNGVEDASTVFAAGVKYWF